MRIIFMGTPDFAVPSLEELVAQGYRPAAVATGPDRPRGRGQRTTPTAVKNAAQRLGIQTILQPDSVKSPEFAAEVKALEPDLIVVVAFRILPPDVFNAARLGAFNLHGSLLPKYRGAAPINHAIMQGETITGVTTFFLRERVDTGTVILQRQMAIGPDETAGDVHDRMALIGAEAVVATVRLIENGDVVPREQDETQATPAPKIHREDCRIRWHRPANEVHNQVRGLSPYPGAWTQHGDIQLKIYRTALGVDVEAEYRMQPGTVIESGDRLLMACARGAVEILEIQQEGKRRLSIPEFLRGYALEPGSILE